jgi:hypothetical protein
MRSFHLGNGWYIGRRRRPLPDCPICEGKGLRRVYAYSDCSGTKTEPWISGCPCTFWPKPRGTDPKDFYKRLKRERKKWKADLQSKRVT